nr:DNA-binding domain-containing protein [Tanacetum cinerariifolium]
MKEQQKEGRQKPADGYGLILCLHTSCVFPFVASCSFDSFLSGGFSSPIKMVMVVASYLSVFVTTVPQLIVRKLRVSLRIRDLTPPLIRAFWISEINWGFLKLVQDMDDCVIIVNQLMILMHESGQFDGLEFGFYYRLTKNLKAATRYIRSNSSDNLSDPIHTQQMFPDNTVDIPATGSDLTVPSNWDFSTGNVVPIPEDESQPHAKNTNKLDDVKDVGIYKSS